MRLFCGLVVLLLLSPFTGAGQHIKDGKGKTYYDEEQNTLKEVYSYKQVTVLSPRSSEMQEKKQVRHGPYFYYFKDGDIKVAGLYKDGQRHGKWEHYTKEGQLRKVVKYREGDKVKVNDNPEQPGDKPAGAED